MNPADYDPKDHAYLTCHRLANELLKAGEILAFSVEHCRQRGRVIIIETTQGWNPDPLYCDNWPEDNQARYL